MYPFVVYAFITVRFLVIRPDVNLRLALIAFRVSEEPDLRYLPMGFFLGLYVLVFGMRLFSVGHIFCMTD